MLRLLILLSLIVTCYTAVAETISKAELMTQRIVNKDKCSLENSDWCPTHVKETKDGFIVYAKTFRSLRTIDLSYENLTAICLLWKVAVDFVGSGNKQAVAALFITDEKDKYVMLARKCI